LPRSVLTKPLLHCVAALYALLFAANLPAQDAPTPVIYAWAEAMADDPRGHYPIELLKLALARSGRPYTAVASKHELGQYRTLRHVQLARDLDVVWTFSNSAREKELLAVPIPIDRGLLGWRLMLINSKDQDKFKQLSVEQLKQLRSGQGHDWPDLTVLQDNSFNVAPSSSYAGLFAMLKRQRIAYFPRSVTEIWTELAQHSDDGIIVGSHWALYYPAPLYFFVSRDKPELAQAIEQGLRAAIADGSMKQLFLQHFADAITRAALTKRQVIQLLNNDLTNITPLTDTSLWFDPVVGY